MELDLQTSAFMGGCIVRLGLAWIFAQSALDALRDRAMHGAIIEQYRLLPRPLVPLVASLLPITLLVTAAGMLIPVTAALSAVLGVALLGLFTLAIAINLARGRDHIDCGCGGAQGQPLSPGLVVRNLVLFALLSCAALAPAESSVDAAVVIGVLGGAAALVGFYFAANALLSNHAALRMVAGE